MPLDKTLQEVIPKDIKLKLYHFSSLIEPSIEPETLPINRHDYTIHFFVASQNDHIIFGMELVVYSGDPHTIYVSKVDTTGCHERSNSPIAGLTLGILRYLINGQHGKVQLRLFAKSQPQYLFPFSSQNGKKHVASDKALVKWWIKIIDGLCKDRTHARRYLIIPGFEDNEVRRYVSKDWTIGHPYDPEARAVDVIRRYPDDPKSRFLEQLESDKAIETTVAEFWELMAHRQEMASGHEIGFITLCVDNEHEEDERPDHGCQLTERMYQKINATIKSESFIDRETTFKATEKFISAVTSLQYNPLDLTGVAEKGHQGQDKRPAVTNILVPRKKKKS